MGDTSKNVLRYGEAEFTERVNFTDFGPRTKALYDHLTGRVIGQDRAAMRLARGFAMRYAGLGESTQPIGSFLFSGPTGWGKTFMAEELARHLIADAPRAPLVRIQCGKYSEQHRVSELIGAPPGYVDSEKRPGLGQRAIDEPHYRAKVAPLIDKLVKSAAKNAKLTEGRLDRFMERMYITNRPYTSVILFDEVEKAHHDLWNALLHIIDDGELVFPHGDRTDFSNSVVILTCNVGGKEQQDLLSGGKTIGFGGAKASAVEEMSDEEAEKLDQRIYDQTMGLIEKRFPPELVGRLVGNIIVFRTLKRSQCLPVLDNMLGKVQERLAGKDASAVPLLLMYTAGFKDFLLEEGVNRKFGLRPLKSAVRKFVRLPLANAIEAGELLPGDEAIFKIDGGKPALYRKPRAQ